MKKLLSGYFRQQLMLSQKNIQQLNVVNYITIHLGSDSKRLAVVQYNHISTRANCSKHFWIVGMDWNNDIRHYEDIHKI